MEQMGKMKEHLAQMVINVKEALNDNPDERLEATWLDAVPLDKDGNPTGEKNEWVINVGNTLIDDGYNEEQEALDVIDMIEGELENEMLERTNENGSMLSPDTITYCNACQNTSFKEVDSCPECGSANVEHITG